MYYFLYFLFLIIAIGMALKNKNKTLCGYDLVLCCTTYAYITIYILIPYIFMKRKRNEWNPHILVRYKNVDQIWLMGCRDAVVRAIEITAAISMSILLSSLIVTDSLCDWTNQNSIFANYTQYEISQIPSISEIVIPAAIIIYFNVLWIEILTFFRILVYEYVLDGICICSSYLYITEITRVTDTNYRIGIILQ